MQSLGGFRDFPTQPEAIRGLAGLLGLLDVKASISIHELLGTVCGLWHTSCGPMGKPLLPDPSWVSVLGMPRNIEW